MSWRESPTSSFNVATNVAAQAVANPSQLALRSATRTLSYGELMDCARRAAAALHAEAIQTGDRVGIAVPDQVLTVVLAIAAWLNDATPVIMDARSRAEERARIARFMGLRCVLQSRLPPGAAEFPSLTCDETWWEALGRRPAPDADIPTGTAPAMITLSSGTTGLPMGTGFTHDRYMLRLAKQWQPGIFWAGQKFLNPLAVAFSASVNHTFNHLFSGNAISFASPLSGPETLAHAILEAEADITFLTRPQIDALLTLEGDFLAGSSLKVVFSGGAYLPEEMLDAATRRIAPTFAYSYSTGVSGQIAIASGDALRRNARSVGRPLPGVLVEIIRPDGSRCAPGEAGLIRVASPANASFVLSHTERTGLDRLEDRWSIPGDLGFLDGDGALTITGRAGNFLIRGGVTLHPEEIEAVLQTCPRLSSVAVTGVHSGTHGEDVVALVVASGPLDQAGVIAHARARLSPAKCPQQVYFVDSLPHNANGKFNRTALRKLAEEVHGKHDPV
jgi:long-chain acyl-CoA synthetase